MVDEATLTSLAMLKVKINKNEDYLDYLRPFVLDVLASSPPELITDTSIASALLERFGLVIPSRTVQIVLGRVARSGVLVRVDAIYRVVKEIPPTDMAVRKAEAARHIAAVVTGLIDYDRQHSQRISDEEGAFAALIAFMSRFAIPCLRAYLRGTAIPDRVSDEDWKVILVGQYAYELQQSNPERFGSLITLVQGHMIANALLCPDLEHAPRSYRSVIFYLDTPLLIRLLGLEGEPKAAATRELMALVEHLGGKFACFSHTLDELYYTILAAADSVSSGFGQMSIAQEARRSGTSRADLIQEALSLEDTLARAHIRIEPTPSYGPQHQIDEVSFGELLDRQVMYNNPKAREHDINSVRSIYVLRRGRYSPSIEKCHAVLVTSNTGFARAAYEFGMAYEESRDASSVITDFSLANTAWLKSPQRAPDLPRRELLAFAYAALYPSERFWSRVLEQAETLAASGHISAREHQLLRSGYVVQEELMKLTLGDEDALSDETLTETFRRVSAEIRNEEAEMRRAAEIEAERAASALDVERTRIREAIRCIHGECDRMARRDAKVAVLMVALGLGCICFLGTRLLEGPVLRCLGTAASLIIALSPVLGFFLDIRAPIVHEWVRTRRKDWYLSRRSLELSALGVSATGSTRTSRHRDGNSDLASGG